MLFDAFFVYRSKAADNPWGQGATSLEWTLSSPPPFHQFNELPGRDLVDRQAGLTH
jgi:cytochrome c oxidase subunit 1